MNRLGRWKHAHGAIVAAEEDIQPLDKLDDAKPLDPIYGNALARTWFWLREVHANTGDDESANDTRPVVDFGVKALDLRCAALSGEIVKLLAPADDAPVLMPAHVDMLCQTSPRPLPEPDVAAYLHGPNRGWPEVRVCWRADLERAAASDNHSLWIDAVETCPPSSAECLSVPLHVLRRWLCGEDVRDDTGDALGEARDEGSRRPEPAETIRRILVWRGKRSTSGGDRSFVATSCDAGLIVANDTLVIPAECGGWNLFGYVPDAPDEPVAGTGAPGDLPKDFARIDVADQAYLQSRARTILRVHPQLTVAPDLRPLYDRLLREIGEPEADLNLSYWRQQAAELLEATNSLESAGTLPASSPLVSRVQRLATSGATIVRYPGGLAWITDRHPDLQQGFPPLPSFGDDSDSLSLTDRVELLQHLADVQGEAQRYLDSLSLPDDVCATLLAAARLHDVGKADPRFQAMLINKPLSLAYMQRQLLAKSSGNGRLSSMQLPNSFRHEMVSLSLIDYLDIGEAEVDRGLLKHQVAAHHGHARPFAPVCVDALPPSLNLTLLGGGVVAAEERLRWCPSHQLDSGIAERFWEATRRYGWWGLAYYETLLRLADWSASARPNLAKDVNDLPMAAVRPRNISSSASEASLVLEGVDGSNPLAFLASLGLFRTLSHALEGQTLRMAWTQLQGAWRPVLSAGPELELDEERVLELVDEQLRRISEDHPALRLAKLVDAEGARAAFSQVSRAASMGNRSDADWLSCNSSDMAGADAISQLQTTRRDYHAINITGLLAGTNREHLRRSFFRAWDYADPIAGVSLHLEPREDRRHAYQWHMPSGDPTRKSWGGMIGANRLALEAWPLFQSLPDRGTDKLTTLGFAGTKANDTQLTWPIWLAPLSILVLPSVLGHRDLQAKAIDSARLRPLGIQVVYRCNRILVGKTPNLTSPTAVLA